MKTATTELKNGLQFWKAHAILNLKPTQTVFDKEVLSLITVY